VIAHHYRFQQIVKGRRVIPDPRASHGFSFTGAPLPFDADPVGPITANQKLRDLDADSQAGRRARQFAYGFHQAAQGSSSHLQRPARLLRVGDELDGRTETGGAGAVRRSRGVRRKSDGAQRGTRLRIC
jgi:hypothetical protein